MPRYRALPRQFKRDQKEIDDEFLVNSRVVRLFDFFGALRRRAPRQLKRDQRERNWGASILVDEKDTIEEKPHREEEPHKSHCCCRHHRLLQREDALGCFDASLAVANLGFHVDLVCREKSLRCFIFSNPCK